MPKVPKKQIEFTPFRDKKSETLYLLCIIKLLLEWIAPGKLQTYKILGEILTSPFISHKNVKLKIRINRFLKEVEDEKKVRKGIVKSEKDDRNLRIPL